MDISLRTRTSLKTIVTLAILGAPQWVLYAHAAVRKCVVRDDAASVLVKGQWGFIEKVGGKDVFTPTFGCYISQLIDQNIPYVILAAVLLIVFSGVQYMLAQGAAAEQAKAKQRIWGVLGGVIFYFLIKLTVPLIAGGISL
jgi:hypothetical protein